MAIYLDSNAMYGWRTFAESDRLALTVLAAELGQAIVVPTLVAAELEGQQRRALESAAAKFEDATATVLSLFELDHVETEPMLDVDRSLARWRTRLDEAFGQCEVTADDAMAGLQREIAGGPPARRPDPKKPGVGGRDVAIWLAVVRDHERRREAGYFISRDGGFWSGEKMNPALIRDFKAGVQPLHLHKTIESFLVKLGDADAMTIEPGDLQVRALPLIQSGLELSPVLPRAVFDDDFDELEFRTDVTHGTVKRVHRAQRFAGELGEILLVDSTWKLGFNLLYRNPVQSADDQWFVLDGLDATGRVQLYLGPAKPNGSGGLFIAAQLKPRQTAFLHEAGAVTIISSSED